MANHCSQDWRDRQLPRAEMQGWKLLQSLGQGGKTWSVIDDLLEA